MGLRDDMEDERRINAPLLAMKLPTSANPVEFAGQYVNFLLQSGLALKVTSGRPYLRPTPFALSYLLPHAAGGVVPNRVYGVSDQFGPLEVAGGIFSRDIAKINQDATRLEWAQKELASGLQYRDLLQYRTDESLRADLQSLRLANPNRTPQLDNNLRAIETELGRRNAARARVESQLEIAERTVTTPPGADRDTEVALLAYYPRRGNVRVPGLVLGASAALASGSTAQRVALADPGDSLTAPLAIVSGVVELGRPRIGEPDTEPTTAAQYTATQAPRFMRGLSSGRRDP